MTLLEGLVWVLCNTYFEARSEPLLGQVATIHVVANRAEIRGLNFKEVILETKQFSWANKGAKLQRFMDNKDLPRDLYIAGKAMIVCGAERMQGYKLEYADHYHTDDVNPKWNQKMDYVITIDKHIFWRSKKATAVMQNGGQ